MRPASGSVMTLESNSVNQTPIEVESSETEEEEEEEVIEKNKLRETLRKNIGRFCLTTDGWTSIKKKSYMALTGHFIDNDWNLVKKVLNFCRLDGHRGIDIGKGVENCLEEWGFTNILSISVDNASANDIRYESIKHIGSAIESIRCGIKWIKKSGARIEKFNKCARSARCESTKSLILDCPTRWNSTYNMLEVAYEYKDAFARYDLEDVEFGLHILNKVNELATIRALLRTQLDCNIHDEPPTDKHLYDIANTMKLKFGKYYGEVENMNLLVYFAFILDPRNKYEFLDVIMDDHYGREGILVVKRPRTTNTSNELDHGDMLRRRMKTGQSSSSSTSELDKYNGKFCEPFDKNMHFDILQWWKVNSQRFPILSLMDRDLLAIPISTVASKSVFSTSGRVLDSYQSSLGDKTIECLVCAQDWLRISLNPEKEEDMDTIAKIEKELMEQEGACLND
ncbi:zinc finger BED domain-containing protein RICESLEEPER 2-like protein [Tanacetum coccineum]